MDLIAALDGDRYIALIRALDAISDAEPPAVSGKLLRRRVRKAVRGADAKLDRAVALDRYPTGGVPLPSTVPQDRDVALHEARKAYKRARYGVELVTPLVGRRGRRLADRLSALQDVLGDHQDSVVAAQIMRDFGMRAQLDGENAFTYGMLYAGETEAGERRLEALAQARRQVGKIKI